MHKLVILSLIVYLINNERLVYCEKQCQLPYKYHAQNWNYHYLGNNIENKPVYTLVGMFPFHKKDCRQVLSTKFYNGFQRAEAMIFALDYVNELAITKNRTIFLDAYILDSCSNSISALDSILQFYHSFDKPISGFVGASYSSVTIPLSTTLQNYNLTMISYASTATDLSNKQLYPYFARLVPSDDGQVRVVNDLIKEMNLKSIVLLSEADSDYSKSLRKKFLKLTTDNSIICRSYEIKKSELTIKKTAKELLESNIDGIVVFITADFKSLILKAFEDILSEASFTEKCKDLKIISTDSWDIGDLKTNKRVQNCLQNNSYVVIPDSSGFLHLPHGKKFIKHLEKLNFHSSRPWIPKVWKDIFNCESDDECHNKQLNLKTFSMDTKVEFVMDTIITFYNALEKCHKELGCDVNSREFFQNYILATNISGVSKCHIEFDCRGDRLGQYGIYRFESLTLNTFKYKKIGSWSEMNSKLQMNVQIYKSKKICRPQCSIGEYEQFKNATDCCYECASLREKGARFYKSSFGTTGKCLKNEWPNANFSSCDALSQEDLRTSNLWAMAAMSISWFGIFLAIVFLIISIYYIEHEVIINCSRELSAFTWCGILIAHLNTLIVFYIFPGPFFCFILRLTMTIDYTFILTSLCLKTNRLFVIFYSQFMENPGILASNKVRNIRHLVLICLAMISFQLVIVFVWILADQEYMKQLYPAKRFLSVCNIDSFHMFLSQSFNVVLLITTFAYSFFTRNIPEDYNDSSVINLSLFTILSSWIIEICMWIMESNVQDDDISQNPERNWALSTMTHSLCGTLILIFNFSPRLYKILLKSKSKEDDEVDDAPQIIPLNNTTNSK